MLDLKYDELESLAVFGAVRNDQVISALEKLLKNPGVAAYTALASAVLNTDEGNYAEHIAAAVMESDNVYVRTLASEGKISPKLENNVKSELFILQKAMNLTPKDLRGLFNYKGYLADFDTSQTDLAREFYYRTGNHSQFGYGIFAAHNVFYLSEDGGLKPVRHPDPVRLSDLYDYKDEQQIIIDNTRALLKGRPAANILLTGDAGTGKSSTIKAVAAEFADQGLRLIELKKSQLIQIPELLSELAENPLHFILFIDDLSFQKDDDDFSALKAVLEGSVSARSRNVAIYVTSNRRHMIRESFSSRDGDDIHANDTMQQLMSLSDRFGIHIVFKKPDKAVYLNIVKCLADDAGLDIPENELYDGAEKYALQMGGRSARNARYYVEMLASED